jgi:hypothetical protein
MPALGKQVGSTEEVQTLSSSDKKAVAVAALGDLGVGDRASVAREAGLGAPGRGTTDTIWLVVIITFCIVLVSSFAALAYTVINKIEGGTLLTVFTTVTAFLAGLLSPSPAATTGGK